MICPKCGSEDVKVQVVSEEVVRVHKHGWVYWLCVSWWIWIFKAMFWLLTSPYQLLKGAKGKTEKYSNTEHSTMCVCQKCGNTWKIK